LSQEGGRIRRTLDKEGELTSLGREKLSVEGRLRAARTLVKEGELTNPVTWLQLLLHSFSHNYP
jgi:hypothetical protein